MNKKLTVIGALALLNLSVAFGTTGLTFNAESGVKTVRVGDRIAIKLKVSGNIITNLVGSTQGAEFLDTGTDSFCYDCSFIAQREGDCVFGPYTVSFGGQTLISQPVIVHVLPKSTGEVGTSFRIDRNQIVLGEQVELVQETWNRNRMDYSALNARIKRVNSEYEVVLGPSLGSMTTSNGVTSYYNRQTWLLKPKMLGIFKITKDLFESLPEGATPPHYAVTVKQRGEPIRHD